MRVLVTGATGFVGSNLARRLCTDGHTTRILVRATHSHPLLEALDLERVQGDVTDLDSVMRAVDGCSLVYHVAGLVSFRRSDWDQLYAVNVRGTENVLRAAVDLGVGGLVFTSAGAVLGLAPKPGVLLDETAHCAADERDGYAYSKQLAERAVCEAAAKGLRAVIVNPSTVYGAGDLDLNSGSVVRAVYRGRARIAPPGGTSAVSVRDLVDGHLLAMSKGCSGERYILNGANVTYRDLLSTIARVVGVRGVRWELPRALYGPAYLAAAVLERVLCLAGAKAMLVTPKIVGETFGFKWYSAAKAKRELGWEPQIPLSDAIREAFDFYQKWGLV